MCSRQEKKKTYDFELYSGFLEFIKTAVTKLDGLAICLFLCLIPLGIIIGTGTLFVPANMWKIL